MFMILDCPKCRKQFPLRGPHGKRFEVSDYIECTWCAYMLPGLEFVGQIRSGEFLEWANAWNNSLVRLKGILRENEQKAAEKAKLLLEGPKPKPKSLWDIVVADAALRKILINEEKLSDTDSSPSIHIVVRSVDRPSRDFILERFKEHLNEVYQYGYIDPTIQCTAMCVAADGKFFDL